MKKSVQLMFVVLVVLVSTVISGQYSKPLLKNLKPSGQTGQPGGRCITPWKGTWSQYLPDLQNCAAFFECSNGKPIHFNCPAGTCWNQNLLTCDYPKSGNCAHPCHR